MNTPKYADRDSVTYNAACPNCGHPLEWMHETPAIPVSFYTWTDSEQRLLSCPTCDRELPAGDLRKQTAA